MMIDRVVRVRAIPRPGETVAALTAQTFAGGKGANQAAAAAKSGARVRMLGRTGRDGAFIREALAEAGVRVRDVATNDVNSGAATVMVAESGENAIVIAPESNLRITKEGIEKFLVTAKQGDIVLFQNECALLHEGIAMAAARALRVWLNAAPANAGLSGLRFEKLAGLIVNESEAEALTGEVDPQRALEALAKRMPSGTVIVTLGADGAIAALGSARYIHRGFVVDAVDTVGCGDAFVGAYLAAITEGRDIAQALARGNAAGALAAMRAGALRSLPSRGEIDVVAVLPEKTKLKPRPPAEDEGAIPANCLGCGYPLVGRAEGDACPECGRVVRKIMFAGRWANVTVRQRYARAWWWAAGAGAAFLIGGIGLGIATEGRRLSLSAGVQDLFGFSGLGCWALHVVFALIAQLGFARGLPQFSAAKIGLGAAWLRIAAVVVMLLVTFRFWFWSGDSALIALKGMITLACAVDLLFVVLLERAWRGAEFAPRRPLGLIAGSFGVLVTTIAVWRFDGRTATPLMQIGPMVIGLLLAWIAQASLARAIAREIRVRE